MQIWQNTRTGKTSFTHDLWHSHRSDDRRKNADELLDAAFAKGIHTFDTARGYGRAGSKAVRKYRRQKY